MRDDVFDEEPGEALPDDARTFFLPVPASMLEEDPDDVERWLETFLDGRRLYDLDVGLAGETDRYEVSITYAAEGETDYGVEIVEEGYRSWDEGDELPERVMELNAEVEAFMGEHEIYAVEHVYNRAGPDREVPVDLFQAWLVYGVDADG